MLNPLRKKSKGHSCCWFRILSTVCLRDGRKDIIQYMEKMGKIQIFKLEFSRLLPGFGLDFISQIWKKMQFSQVWIAIWILYSLTMKNWQYGNPNLEKEKNMLQSRGDHSKICLSWSIQQNLDFSNRNCQ